MPESHDVIFLFDVDNTLLDNDSIVKDLADHLEQRIGAERRDRYFAIFEQLRVKLGYADYLGALQQYRIEHPADQRILGMSSFLVDYPFGARLFPRALEVIAHCGRLGPTAVLSDGDVVFQPRKVERSGIWGGVDGRVMIYIHKEEMLADVEVRQPAAHYVMVDDKVRILAAVKKHWGARVTTVFPRQGHYALDAGLIGKYPAPDVTVERIGDLIDSPALAGFGRRGSGRG